MNIELFEIWAKHGDTMLKALGEHVFLAVTAVFLGMLVAIPLGIWLVDRDRYAKYVLGGVGVIQTIPSLALFGLVLPFLGIGTRPALFVLMLYSILPILRNTYTGIKEVSPVYVEAGKGMGMSRFQLLGYVELPLALPVIMAGIRISIVYIIAWATLAAAIGAGGLGDLIFGGIAVYDYDLIMAGAVPAAILALVASWLLGALEKVVTPKGIRRS